MYSGQSGKDDIYGFKTFFREVGYYISRLEQYERSLVFFDRAIAKTPDDKRALIGRSRARAKAIQYQGALEDIIKALKLDPDDLIVLADSALNTYLLCEFEQGLIQNSRLSKLRQKPDSFVLGVMHCSDAIENCLGERAGRPLRDHFKIIRRLAWRRNWEAQRPFEPKPTYVNKKKKKNKNLVKATKIKRKEAVQPKKISVRIKAQESKDEKKEEDDIPSIKDSLHSHKADAFKVPRLPHPFPYKPLQNYTTNIENYMAEKYLDTMYLDKIFLKELQTISGAACPNKRGSNKIKQLARNGLKTVSYKQEIMRTRRPFYFIKYQEATSSGNLKARQEHELEKQRMNAKKDADAILFSLQTAFFKHELRNMLELADKLRFYCENKPKKLLPDKEKYMEEIYDMVCKGYFNTWRLNANQTETEQLNRVTVLLGLPAIIGDQGSADSVVEEVREGIVDYNKMIGEYENRLEEALLPDEIAWYYYELARNHFGKKQSEMARVYARKCAHEGKQSGNNLWMINGILMMARCNLQQRNRNDAENDIKEAQGVAKAMKDKKLEKFLAKCLKVVTTTELEDMVGSKIIEKREQKIISMMSTGQMKEEVSHLFRQMSAMPSSRRMNIMPGVGKGEDPNAKRKSSARMTIKPIEKKGSADAMASKTTRAAAEGMEFMNLM